MIQLNYRDAKPIYEQIKEGFRKLILSGALKQDEKLPSVRELSGSLAINPNTIQRAYRDLEQEGFIYTVSGKGSFAAAVSEVGSERRQELLKVFNDTAKELIALGVNSEELTACIEKLGKGGGSQ